MAEVGKLFIYQSPEGNYPYSDDQKCEVCGWLLAHYHPAGWQRPTDRVSGEYRDEMSKGTQDVAGGEHIALVHKYTSTHKTYLDFFVRSRVMCKIIAFFLENNDDIHMRGLANLIKEDINGVCRHLKRLESVGFVTSEFKNGKHFYRSNKVHPAFSYIKSIASIPVYKDSNYETTKV